MSIRMIVAASKNGVIGNNGKIPWYIPEDLMRFKMETMHKPVIMGRATWESLPVKPLYGRVNIVLSSNADFKAEGAIVVDSVSKALTAAMETQQYEQECELFIIGGENVYRQFLDVTDEILYTKVDIDCVGDARFPYIDIDTWDVSTITPKTKYNEVEYEVFLYAKKNIHYYIQNIVQYGNNGDVTVIMDDGGSEKRYMMANKCLDANLFVLPIKVKPEDPEHFKHYKIYKHIV